MNFLKTRFGKSALGVLFACGVVLLIYKFFFAGSQSDSARELNTIWMVCSETGKAFQVDLASVSEFPVYSSASGKKTGYKAELCYWNEDGSTRTEPSKVLLNRLVDKPGPTFCPDCGRLVVERNPRPGSHPPPLKSEYKEAAADPEAR